MQTTRRNFIRQTSIAATGLLASGLISPQANANPGADHFRSGIKKIMAVLRIPGLLAAVVQDGKTVYTQAEGMADLAKQSPMTTDAIFPVASLTKTVAAVLIAQYEEEGKMSMDDFVLDYPYLSVGYSPEYLQNPNVRIRHALSHTSDGVPGTNYIYDGGRYNLVYGVFEKISGNAKHYEAFADETKKRFINRLQLKHTYTGYPTNSDGHVVSTYTFDEAAKQFSTFDKGQAQQTILYPSTGLYTCLDDLITYTIALDEHRLITEKSYRKITTPTIGAGNRLHPYGIGWSSQKFEGKDLHWHYGYGDSFAALIIRVPSQRLSFIMFSNAVPASEAFWLGNGNITNSPFACLFLNEFVAQQKLPTTAFGITQRSAPINSKLYYDTLFSYAMMYRYTKQKFNTNTGEAVKLLHYLFTHDPERAKELNVSYIGILAAIADPGLAVYMESLVNVYEQSGYFHPDTHRSISDYYKKSGEEKKWIHWQHLLADSKGFENQGNVKQACVTLGNYYLSLGEIEKGRSYVWRSVLYNRYLDNGTKDAADKIILMKI